MEDTPNSRTYWPTIGISLILFVGVFLSYQSARSRPGTIVLPGGITYLGPTPSPISPTSPSSPSASWSEYKGKLYQYVFQYPSNFSLGWFPNDPYDAVTVFLPNTDSNTNIFFRVDDLTKLNKTSYIGKPREYAENWWKDYAWKGVDSVTSFTNSKGLKGYRAKYLDQSDKTPSDHVFFEVPGRNDLIIWMSGKLFDPEVFGAIVDSVTWKQ